MRLFLIPTIVFVALVVADKSIKVDVEGTEEEPIQEPIKMANKLNEDENDHQHEEQPSVQV